MAKDQYKTRNLKVEREWSGGREKGMKKMRKKLILSKFLSSKIFFQENSVSLKEKKINRKRKCFYFFFKPLRVNSICHIFFLWDKIMSVYLSLINLKNFYFLLYIIYILNNNTTLLVAKKNFTFIKFFFFHFGNECEIVEVIIFVI